MVAVRGGRLTNEMNPTRVVSRKSLAEQEIEIVDRDFLCRQQSRKAQTEVSVRESWEEDGFLYTKEGDTIWVRPLG